MTTYTEKEIREYKEMKNLTNIVFELQDAIKENIADIIEDLKGTEYPSQHSFWKAFKTALKNNPECLKDISIDPEFFDYNQDTQVMNFVIELSKSVYFDLMIEMEKVIDPELKGKDSFYSYSMKVSDYWVQMC